MEKDLLIALVATFVLILVGRFIAYGAELLFTKFVCSKCECRSCCESNNKITKEEKNVIESNYQQR